MKQEEFMESIYGCLGENRKQDKRAVHASIGGR